MILTQLLDRLCQCCIKKDAEKCEVNIYNSRSGLYLLIKNISIDCDNNIEIEVV